MPEHVFRPRPQRLRGGDIHNATTPILWQPLPSRRRRYWTRKKAIADSTRWTRAMIALLLLVLSSCECGHPVQAASSSSSTPTLHQSLRPNTMPVPGNASSWKEEDISEARKPPRQRHDEVAYNNTTRRGQVKNTSPTSSRNERLTSPLEMASLRRLQKEWQECIEHGVAFDWQRGQLYSSPPRGVGALPHNAHQDDRYLLLGPLSRRNLLVWHFTFGGVPASPYALGLYHGRVTLPRNYPAAPPRITMWTGNGRFVPHVDICLSASSYHPESWQPASWSVRALVESLRLHMLTTASEVGGMHASYEQRRRLARASRCWKTSIARKGGQRQSEALVIDHAALVRYFTAAGNVESAEGCGTDAVVPEASDVATREAMQSDPVQYRDSALRRQHHDGREGEQVRRSGRASMPSTTTANVAVLHLHDSTAELEHTLPLLSGLISAVHRLLASPGKIAVLVFAILFIALNRP